jgi:thymidylate kinase
MKSILLEGTELSGKTTIVRELEKLSNLERLTVKTNKGHINRLNPVLDKLYDLAERVPPGNVRELFYTVGLILDKNPEKVYGNTFDLYIQERSFPSIIAYSKVFHRFGFSKYFGELFLPFYPSFDFNLLISCSNFEREKRFKQRSNMTFLDEKIRGKMELAEMLELEMRSLLMSQKNYIEILTDNKSPEKIARHILEILK